MEHSLNVNCNGNVRHFTHSANVLLSLHYSDGSQHNISLSPWLVESPFFSTLTEKEFLLEVEAILRFKMIIFCLSDF